MMFFKYQKLIHYSIIIISIILISITILVGSMRYISIVALGILIIIWITLKIFKKKQSIIAMDMLNIYLDNCDPTLFIDKVTPIAYSRWAYDNTKYYWQLWIVNALLDQGDIDEAYKAFKRIKLEKIREAMPNGELVYFTNELCLDLENHELNKAEEIYISISCNNNYRDNRDASEIIQLCEARIAYYKKDYDYCYDYFLRVFNDCRTNMKQKVLTAYRLGVICSEKNNGNEENYFFFVLTYGNKMNVVRVVKDMVNK